MTTLKQTIKTIDFARNYYLQTTLIKHNLSKENFVCFYANNAQIAPYLMQDFNLFS